ncbi:polysaccharide biosynthesis protein [Clostridium sp. CAG:1013]|nr:polysaccharide biosynthesis protein [Clostridium sp. CAG:1013]
MLQAVGRADLPVKLLLAAMAIKLGANWLLCGIPEVNILGASVGTLLCYLFLVVCQFRCLRKAAGVSLSTVTIFFRPLACALVCGGGARFVYDFLRPLLPGGQLGEGLSLLAGTFLGAVLYFGGLLMLRGIRKRDLQSLPNGQKIAKMLEKQGWI